MLRRIVIAVFALISLPAAAMALDQPSEFFSQEVSVVIRLKNPTATFKKVEEFAAAIQEQFGQVIAERAKAMGLLISNPDLAGVDKEQDWWMGAFASENSEPTMLFVIPASDKGAMKEAIEAGGFQFIDHGKWGVYTTDAWTADNVKERIEGKNQALMAEADIALRDTFDSGDLSVFVNVKQLAETYDTRISDAKDQLQQSADTAPPGAEMAVKMYLEMAEPLFQSLEDATGAVLACSVDKQGVTLEGLGKVKAESKTAEFLKGAPAETPLLARLPAGAQGYFALSRVPKELMQMSVSMMQASQQALGQDEEAFAEVTKIMQRLQKLDYGGAASSWQIAHDGDNPGIRTVSVTEVSQPQQMKLISKELLAAQSELEFPGVKTTYEYTEDAESIGQQKVDTIEMTQEFEQNQLFDMEKIYEVLFGEDGMLTRVVYTDTQAIQTLGGGKKSMEETLTRMEQSSPPQPGEEFEATRNMLSTNANLVVLADLPGSLARLARLVLNSDLVPFPIDPDAFDIPETTSYFGLSVATEEAGVRAKVYLPAVQAKNGYLFGMQVFQAFQNMQMQQRQF